MVDAVRQQVVGWSWKVIQFARREGRSRVVSDKTVVRVKVAKSRNFAARRFSTKESGQGGKPTFTVFRKPTDNKGFVDGSGSDQIKNRYVMPFVSHYLSEKIDGKRWHIARLVHHQRAKSSVGVFVHEGHGY